MRLPIIVMYNHSNPCLHFTHARAAKFALYVKIVCPYKCMSEFNSAYSQNKNMTALFRELFEHLSYAY